MIDAYGLLIAWTCLIVSIVSLARFAFGTPTQRANDRDQQLFDGIHTGDVRAVYILNRADHGSDL